uniref:Uncharacterized protein n=1 Tax=Cyanoderma ruficeps TaxID=181631 RepID=A0A8C3RIA0_9PASS
MDYQAFREAPLPESCCLNFTSSNITHLDWGALVGVQGLRELYLSHCSITAISNAQGVPPALEILHLSHNLLESLPGNFLENAPNLRVLYLDSNQLQELPMSFLKASSQVQEVYLGFNALTFLPASLLKPSLLQLQLSNNSWDCSCALLTSLEGWPRQAAEVICHTPEHYHGVGLQSIPRDELCRSHGLTALFICVPPLLILTTIAWCFCRQKKKTNYSLQSRSQSHRAMAGRSSEGHGGKVGAGFEDQVMMLCVCAKPTDQSFLSCWSQMVSGTDLLLSNLQRTWSGDMKQGWPCLCGLQGVLHLDRVPWACQGKPVVALPAAHPTLYSGTGT